AGVGDAEVSGGADLVDAGRHVGGDRDLELALDRAALRIDPAGILHQRLRRDAGMREDEPVRAVEIAAARDADVDRGARPGAGGLEGVDLGLGDLRGGGLLARRGQRQQPGEERRNDTTEYLRLHHSESSADPRVYNSSLIGARLSSRYCGRPDGSTNCVVSTSIPRFRYSVEWIWWRWIGVTASAARRSDDPTTCPARMPPPAMKAA